VAPGAIYLVERSGNGGSVVGNTKEYWAYDARVSPTGDLVAFHGRVNGWDGEGIGVFNTNGVLITFVPRGVTFAWSPRGTRLAVTLAGTDGFGAPVRRGLTLWNRKFGSQRSFRALPSRVGWAGEDSLLLQLGDRVDVIDPRSGARATAGHHGTIVSPDGFYSMWPGEGGRNTRVIEDETNLDVTSRLFGPLERQGLHEIRSAFWVRGTGADHFMCVSGSDHVFFDNPRCITAIIDADTGETIGSFPGEALGPTGDSRMAVVLRHETGLLETVNMEEIVRRWVRSGGYY